MTGPPSQTVGEVKSVRTTEMRREQRLRSAIPVVAIVGYTNAGKSTLLNRLTDSDVFVKDLLFATLDTRTRRWFLPGWGPVLLSDTVGFIRDLPHHLIASFRATLEEATGADLLLHVADAGNPDVNLTLQRGQEIPMISLRRLPKWVLRGFLWSLPNLTHPTHFSTICTLGSSHTPSAPSRTSN